MEKICSYRNCKKELPEGKRKDAKYCNTSCKKMEQTYRKRKALLIEKYKQNGLEEVKLIKFIKNLVKS